MNEGLTEFDMSSRMKVHYSKKNIKENEFIRPEIISIAVRKQITAL